MLDAHFHRRQYETFLGEDGKEVRFVGLHPWEADEPDAAARLAALPNALAADPLLGVGEIGLDRLRSRTISDGQRQTLAQQLELAAAFRRPVVLHGAKCWGEVVKACKPYAGRIPSFLFHGFSRSDGLIPDIVALNGYISVGPTILNDHAVNYRELAKRIPLDRLLVESDRTPENAATVPSVDEIAAYLAALRGIPFDTLAAALESNATRFAAI